MKKEKNSDLREALRSIINERQPATDNWQQSVLDSLEKEKPRYWRWWHSIAAAAAVAAVIITATYIHRQFSAESEIIYSEIIAPVEPVKSETQPLPEAVTTSEPEPTMATATKPKPKRKSETQSLQEPIVIFDTDYLANGNTPDPDSDLMPDEWIESLLASELTNRYISMISMLETEEEEETSNTPEL